MAYIQEKVKGKKIVSFKIKACLGRDLGGKQLFKCTTWYPPADLTPAKARKEAQKVAAIWEDEVRQAYLKEREEKAVAGVSPAYTFDTFVNEVWIPLCVRDGSHRPATVAMYTNILKVILPLFQSVPLDEMLYLASQRIVKHWHARCQIWDMVLSQLEFMFTDRKVD